MRILMSACLAGLRTRYDDVRISSPQLEVLAGNHIIVPVCPEILGGLGIPRPRCHFVGGDGKKVLEGKATVVNAHGTDVTSAFLNGADETRRVVRLVAPDLIIFKEGSPSCGLTRVDVEGKKQPGCGVTVARLLDLGIPMQSETGNVS